MKIMAATRPHLPIDDRRDELLDAFRKHQVVVVAGDTGSGKTTQMPQLLLELGLGEGKLVGCTQPRRVAAVSVAERVAQERGCVIGGEVGWQHRFGQALSGRTRIKFMTDGILLAETRGDAGLRRYGAIMVDEAHERSLNIDFLLGYLKRLLPRRPDLKVVVASATMDVERIANFFRSGSREVPIVEIPGRTYPVEVRYRPDEDEDADLPERVARGVEELWTSADGDILVFLPGERDIREAEESVTRLRLPDTDVLPFMASLPAADQRRVFHPVKGRRRVVLSTNVAETSLTIPGIRMVVDSGLARINRFSPRSKVERLHIEPISQASANQRKGRCGRVGPGICLRLYAQDDFVKRPEYTEPELRRSSLSGVILSMADLRLGKIEQFPFLDPPGSGAIREGYKELWELGAMQEDGRLTGLGRAMVRFPVEPRFARMILAGLVSGGEGSALRDEVLTVVSALATEDPRLRPLDKKAEADQKQAQFGVKGGDDYGTVLRLWSWFQGLPSRTAQRKQCKENFLSFRRFQEWGDVREQLCRAVGTVDCARLPEAPVFPKRGPVEPHVQLLQALLTGMLSQIGRRDPESADYRGVNGVHFSIHPGSALAKRGPDWVMAAELVDTSRLYARRCAPIEVEWIEPLAGALCSYTYHSPFWDERVGTARALEHVTFHGLVLHDGRHRDYSRIDPDFSREMFVRHGLVLGELPTALPEFVRKNLQLFETIRDAHRKLREPEDAEDEAFVARYLERLPRECVNLPALRQWLRHAPAGAVEALLFRREDFSMPDADPSLFPSEIRLGGHRLHLTYRNEEGAEDDGITCTLSVEALGSLQRWPADWLVPGALPGKVEWMLGRLTRAQARPLPPRTQLLADLPRELGAPDRPLEQAMRELLRKRWRVEVPEGLWDASAMPDHLKVRFRILDAFQHEVYATRDPVELAAFVDEFQRLSAPPEATSGKAQAKTASVARGGSAGGAGKGGIWPWGPLPESASVENNTWRLKNYPALTAGSTGVELAWYANREEAAAVHRAGVRQLLAQALGRDFTRAPGAPQPDRVTTLGAVSLGIELKELPQQAALAAIDTVLLPVAESVPRDAESFQARLDQRRGSYARAVREHLQLVYGAIALAGARLAEMEGLRLLPETESDLREQLQWLFFPGFAQIVPTARLRRYGCYLEAMRLRLERARQNPRRDVERTALIRTYWERYTEWVARPSLSPEQHRALDDIRWAIEEFRVSTHAQELRTPEPISPQRLERLFAAV